MRQRRSIERLALIVLLAGGLATAPAVAGKFRKLPHETEVPRYAELLRADDALPREYYDLYLHEGDGRPVRLALEEVGQGDPSRLVVLIHGALSNRDTWRFMVGDLGRDHRLLLIDMLGSGDSQKVDPAQLGPGGYGPTRQARRVLKALRTFIARRDTPTTGLTIVGHSLGGAIVLRLAGAPELREEFADVLDRVDRVVLMAALDFAVEKADPAVVEIVKLGKAKVGLAKMTGLLRSKAAQFTLDAYVDPDIATHEEAFKMVGVLRERRTRRPAQAQFEQAIPFDPKKRKPDWERIEALVEDYANVTFPCLILWGARDETLPLSMGYKLQAQLPDARLVVLHETKHSMQLERPRASSSIVREFIVSGTRGRARILEIGPDRL